MTPYTYTTYKGYYRGPKEKGVYLLKVLPPERTHPIYKIGFSVDPVQRCYTSTEPICANFPFPVLIMCSYESVYYKHIESDLHHKFEPNRIRLYSGTGCTEWFDFGDRHDVGEMFINACMDSEKEVKTAAKKTLKPEYYEIDYTDNFDVSGNWNTWYYTNSPASKYFLKMQVVSVMGEYTKQTND